TRRSRGPRRRRPGASPRRAAPRCARPSGRAVRSGAYRRGPPAPRLTAARSRTWQPSRGTRPSRPARTRPRHAPPASRRSAAPGGRGQDGRVETAILWHTGPLIDDVEIAQVHDLAAAAEREDGVAPLSEQPLL